MFRINSIKFHNFRNILDSTIYLTEPGSKTDIGGCMVGIYGANGSSKSSVGYAAALLSKVTCGMCYAFFHDFDNDFGIYDDTMSLEFDFDYSNGERFNGLVIKILFKKYKPDDIDKEIPYIAFESVKLKVPQGRPMTYEVSRDFNYLNLLMSENEVSHIAELFSSDIKLVYALYSTSVQSKQSMLLNLNVLRSFSNDSDKANPGISEQLAYISSFLTFYFANTAFIMPDSYGTSITNNLFAIFGGDVFNTQYLIKSPNGYFQCDSVRLSKIEKIVETSNRFIGNVIPDFEVTIEKKELDTDNKGITNYQIRLYSSKGKGKFSFENESEGIKRLFLIASSIAKVMNESDYILFIDEFDEGIFEVLFGDIIKSIKSQCMGQFIFTSHNLRPLEVMEYTHFIFSTTNPKNRFVTLKGIKPRNNLRDIYIRKIMYGDENNLSEIIDESDILGGLINA